MISATQQEKSLVPNSRLSITEANWTTPNNEVLIIANFKI